MKITKQRLKEIIKEELETLQQEVRAPFPTGSRVKHEDYGVGRVTHAGTKNTNVAVKFDNEGRDGKKNRQVSRGSLKRAEIQEEFEQMNLKEKEREIVDLGKFETTPIKKKRRLASPKKHRPSGVPAAASAEGGTLEVGPLKPRKKGKVRKRKQEPLPPMEFDDDLSLGETVRKEVNALIIEKGEKWIQGAEKDIERRGTEGICTGKKFGGPTCRSGTKRYNLAKTFRKMAKKRKK
tara:strand:- start:1813 stop:2520 length:708 start_codon:yes stop_codon:yes gene_type:complete